MKSFQLFLVAAIIACASAFAPMPQQRTAVTQLAAAPKMPESFENKKAAVAAFATAVAPVAAANAIDEGVVIGYGAGLVACVVSLAVGFAIGYGTLAKL
eukprot:CAMPEP_0172438960 /NCGR_PEP_ID=MMETSP1065-20121228/70_1 /TAXON_ID=265537 /ORGANISM="Amphiprora paludosa, Strain CCMP125" /LENGTH=98 /DNA_ID=CAMNT_0013187565 /DNA_START=278 /DNA_END=574 /DNA_ORIENTATION=-